MEKPNHVIEVKSDEDPPEESLSKGGEEQARAEVLEFVLSHKNLFENYGRGVINFEPAPPGLNTFAFDLKTNTIYINSNFYTKLGFSKEKTVFATLHEIEHFLEKKALLQEEGGQKVFDDYIKEIESSEARSITDNCIADIRENRSVVQKTNEAFREIEEDMYQNDLFKETDFTKEPKHLQFPQAILREHRVPGQTCDVSPEVRQKIDEFLALKTKSGQRILDVMTDPNLPMSARLRIQDKYLWPIVQELLEQDLKEEKEKREKSEKTDKKGKRGKGGKKGKARKGKTESKEQAPNPNEIFKRAYDMAKKRVMPKAVPLKDIKKAVEEWKKSPKENPLEKADEEYAAKLGVKKEDLQKYRKIVESFEKIINPETGESVIGELRNLIERIITKRLKPQLAPRYPVEEGEELVDPAQLVADVKAGNLEPKVWETYEAKEKRGQHFGEVEVTLICDRSGSMQEGSKLKEQQRAAVLLMEALKEFSERTKEENINLTKPLEVRSQIYSFQADNKDAVPLKEMSDELGEKERIEVAGTLSAAPGKSTTDFIPLETIFSRLNEKDKNKIIEGELKKIVIVFTDGQSDNAGRVKKALENLRSAGVVVVCVGITKDGIAALQTYAPDARLAEKAEDLAKILADLLKEHLSDI